VQVFTPIVKFGQQVTGTIDLKLSAIAHADTCAPLTNCLATANFTSLFDCNTDESVKFVNFSTYGTSITYNWNFGSNGQTSSDVSPLFFYPPLPNDSTYTVKLVVENTSCGKRDSVVKTVTVPGRPYINFGNDINRCDGSSITLTATSFPGATYAWQDGSTADTFRVTANGNNQYWVKINYNGCSHADTVKVVISNITARPLQNIILCADSVSINASRGQGETYLWNTGAASASIYVSNPGVYWADVKYFTCTYRDSFVVNNVNTARPLGNDTTVCISSNGYVLRATTAGAQSYSWSNGSNADTLKISAPGQYNVAINFGSCTVRDTVDIGGFPAAIIQNMDTSLCSGSSLTLPWGAIVGAAGVYNDTLRYGGGCDSLIRKITVTVNPKPNLGRDTILCLAQNPFVLNGTVAGAISYQWQDGSAGASFNVTTPGLYWVKANFANCSTRDSITISGSAPPVTSITDTSICDGLTLTLPWGINVNTSGSYRDTIASVLGCDSVIRIVNITVKNKPSLGSDNTGSICNGSIFDLTVPFQTVGLTTLWTIGSTTVANPAAVSAAGVYQLIATNTVGCSDSALFTLSYSPKPVLGNDTAINICQGNAYNLNDAYITTNLTAEWTIGGVLVADPAAAGTGGVYQLVVINNSGCTDTALLTLTVNPKPSLGNDTTISICPGNTVNLTSIYTTTGLTSVWTYNLAPVINPSAVTASGTYRLIAKTASGCTDTALVTIVFNPQPSLGNDKSESICSGAVHNLLTDYSTTNLSAAWTINNIAVVNPAAVSIAGAYRVIAANTFGCKDTAVVTLTVNAKPSLGNDTTVNICNGKQYNLATVYATTGLNSAWTLNGNVVSSPTAAATAGIYQLIVTNSTACSDTALVTLKVNPKPVLGNDTAIAVCQGTSLNLTVVYNTNGLATGWAKNGVPVINPAAVATPGLYQLVGTTALGCSDSASVTLTINPKPNLGNDTIVNICQGDNLNLTTVYNTGSNINHWTKGGIAVVNPAAVNTVGVYQLISTNPAGCADTVLLTLIVNANPVVVINNPATICIPQTTDLTLAAVTAGSTPGLNYTYWQDAAVTIAYNNSTAATAGTYYIKGISTFGCFDIKPVTVTTFALPVVTAGNDVGICDKDSVATLSATVTNISAPVSYDWQPAATGGISNPAAAATIVKPTATPQQYIITITDGYGCNYKVSDTVIVTKQPPVPAFAGNDTIAVTGLPHQLFATGGVNYIWSPDNVLNNPYVANPLATLYADSTLFSVIVIDNAGCKGYDSVWVKAYDGITYYVPNAFSPNGDGWNDVFRPVPVGIVATDYFRIFNRYGQLLFETSEWMKGWDGNYKGIPQAAANYVWVLRGKGRNGKIIEMRGNVVLVR